MYSAAYYLLSKAGLEGKGAEQMGWLKQPGTLPFTLPSVMDKTSRFEFLMSDKQSNESETLEFPRGYTYLLVPGLLWEIYEGYFEPLKSQLYEKGYPVQISRVSGTGAVKNNARLIVDEIKNLHRIYGNKVVMIGHSKGGVDCAAALVWFILSLPLETNSVHENQSLFQEDLNDLVAGLVTVQSPYAGAPLAEEAMMDPELQSVLRAQVEGSPQCHL